MKKFLVIFVGFSLLLTVVTYCSKDNPEQIAQKKQQEQIQQQKEAAEAEKARLEQESKIGIVVKSVDITIHACDNNGGVKKIKFYNNNLFVDCHNTVSTDYDKVYENLSKQQ